MTNLTIIESAAREIKVNALNLLEYQSRVMDYALSGSKRLDLATDEMNALIDRLNDSGIADTVYTISTAYLNEYGHDYRFDRLLSGI